MAKTINDLDKRIQIDLSNFSVNGHTHDYTTYIGDHAETAGTDAANSPYTGMAKATTRGMYLTGTYNDAATPVTYGNIINLAGRGTGQILCEWLSGTTSATGKIFYRSHRDTTDAPWGPWKQIAFTDSNISGSAANAATADKLTTARTLTIGNTGKTFDGSANVSWTLSEIGAFSAAGGTITGNLHLSTDNSSISGICGGGTDRWSILGGGADDNGYLEIQTRDNGNEPIYVRQYNASGLVRTATLLDGSGNTSFPGTISEGGTTLSNKYAAANHGTHVSYATAVPKANGTAAIGSVNRVAREDHVHPLQTSVSGNAGTATKLATARTLTIGSTGKTFDGSGNVSWTLTEIGAAASSHSHSAIVMNNCSNKDLNTIKTAGWYYGYTGMTNAPVQNISVLEVIVYSADWVVQRFTVINADGKTYERHYHSGTTWGAWKTLYDSKNKPSPTDIGAAASSHTHAYLPTAGGTMTGKITTPNNAQGITIGDDVTICDRNIADHLVLEGSTATNGGITFGSGKDTNIYRGGTNLLKTDDTFNAVGGFQWNGTSLDSRYAASSHTHNYLQSRGTIAPQTGRTQALGDVYSYHTNASANAGAPTTYSSVIGFGKGVAGTVEICGEWTGGKGLWFRALRDVTDNWYDWTRVYTTAYKPTPADLGLQREYKSAVADIYSSGITTGGSTLAADTYASHGKSYSFASTTTATVIYKAAFPELKYGKYAICVRMMSSNNTNTSNIAKIEILQGTTVKKTVNLTGKNFTSTSNYSYIYTDFEYTGNASAKQALSIQVSSLTVSGITLKFDYASIEMMSPAVFL